MDSDKRGVEGHIFDIENFATVDGPGIRSVVFLQGCPLRCVYCHNPESRPCYKGESVTASDVLNRVLAFKTFMQNSGGGLTLSGGEPLLQAKFAKALLSLAKHEGLHTAVDTSGAIPWSQAGAVIENCDLVLLDIKAGNPQLARRISALDWNHLLSFVNGLNQTSVKVWVRHVLVSGWNAHAEALDEVATFAHRIHNLERFDLLPFHQLGRDKWGRCGLEYPLANHPETDSEVLEQARELLTKRGLPVVV